MWTTVGVSGNNKLAITLIPFNKCWGRRGRDRMVLEFTTTYAIGTHHH